MDKDKDEEKGNPILVRKDKDSGDTGAGMRYAHALPNKGVNDYAVQVVIKDLERLGHKRIILKNDQEPAVMALRTAVKARCNVEIVRDKSLVYGSASNGEIESTIRTIQDQIRTIFGMPNWSAAKQ